MAKLIEEIEKKTEQEATVIAEQDLFRLLLEHSEEISSLLDLIRAGSESGLFTLVKGLLENKGESIGSISDELVKPKNMRFVRNLMSIYTLLSNIDPDIVRNFMLNLARAVDSSSSLKEQGSMGLMALRSNMKDEDVAVGFRVLFEVAKGFTRSGNKKE